MSTSWQLVAFWLVNAWDRVTEDLVRKAWEVTGYQSVDDLGGEGSIVTMVNYDEAELGSIMENISSDYRRMVWIYHGNHTEEPCPDEDDHVNWDVGEDTAIPRDAAEQQGSTATTAMPIDSSRKAEAAARQRD